MQIASPTPPARHVAPAPQSGNASADASGSDFAGLLQGAAPEPAPGADDRADPAGTAGRETRSGRAPARPAQARSAERPASERTDAARVDDAVTEPAEAEATDEAPDRQLLDWIAGLHVPAVAPTGAAVAEAEVTASLEADAEAPALPGLPGLGLRRPGGAPLGAEDTSAAIASRATDARDKAGATGAALRTPRDIGEAPAADTAAAATRPDGFRAALDALAAPRAPAATETNPIAAGAATHAASAAPASGETAAPVAVPMPTPLSDPQFPRAFGVQVSVLARDGVQQAELHLNPAEMGPVAVQIVMDGTQARIEFGADAAGTRQLIESSLPDLAAALREAGLTLSGGGVSQHPSGRNAGDGSTMAGRAGDADAAEADRPAAPPRRQARAGGVDVYA